MGGKASLVKGKCYEREVAQWFRENFDCTATRSQQYCGKGGDADLAINMPIHVECKRVEAFSLYTALSQAKADAKEGVVPVVIHRKNNKPSVLIIELDKLKELIAALQHKIK